MSTFHAIGKQAPPGTYESTITVTSDAGDRVELSLSLDVWDFALPDETHLAGNIHTDTEINTLAPELEVKYYQMIRRHRLAMGVLGYAPDTTVKGSDIQFDWTSYDARLGKYLDGSAFTEKYGYSGPGYGVPIELLILPFDAYPTNDYYNSRHVGWPYGKEWKFYRPWPVEVPKGGVTPEYGEVWKKAFQRFQEHFDQHPAWNRTKPIVFLLSLDESYDEPSIEKMLYYGRLLKESGAKRLKYPHRRLLSHGHDGPPGGRGGHLDPGRAQLCSGARATAAQEGRGRLVLHRHGEDGRRSAGLPRAGLGVLEISGALVDHLGIRLQLTARVDVPRDVRRNDNGDVQNGEGFLIYRGETMGLEEPVASIRLKLLRRGSQDYEYFWLLARKEGRTGGSGPDREFRHPRTPGNQRSVGRTRHVEPQRGRMGARPLQDGRSHRKTSGRATGNGA